MPLQPGMSRSYKGRSKVMWNKGMHVSSLWKQTRSDSHLADIGHFHKSLFGLPVLVQLQCEVSSIWWPSHVKNPKSHETGDQSGIMCRVQEQLPVCEKSSELRQSTIKCVQQMIEQRDKPVWCWWAALKFLIHVGQKCVQEGAHAQLQVLSDRKCTEKMTVSSNFRSLTFSLFLLIFFLI